eukprot:TRINITY_DN15295_c0_g1_i1.p1 TRINITY_DN15295_c0_g1~~TRINITY_DN15295_c0_g1_i1.p1  ORF type:complete len:313 (-),score=38.22 TRINITY_DN15295_c0_g1_i1:564-1502(-)
MAYLDTLWDVEGEISEEQFKDLSAVDITSQCDASVSKATELLNTGSITVPGFHAVVHSSTKDKHYIIVKGAHMANLLTQHFSLVPRETGGYGQALFSSRFLLPDRRALCSTHALMLTLSAPVVFLHRCDDDVAVLYQTGAPLRIYWYLPRPADAPPVGGAGAAGEAGSGAPPPSADPAADSAAAVADPTSAAAAGLFDAVHEVVLGPDITRGHVLFHSIPGGAWRALSLQAGQTSFAVAHEVVAPSHNPEALVFASPAELAEGGVLHPAAAVLSSFLAPTSAAAGAAAAGAADDAQDDAKNATKDPSATPKE